MCVCVCKGSGCVLVFTNANRFRPCQNARAIGITCPILPGHMVVQTYRGFKRFTTWCKTKVPREMSARLEEVKDNDEAVKAYGVELGTRTCEQLLASGTRSLHFYTMNQAAPILLAVAPSDAKYRSALASLHWPPWRTGLPHGMLMASLTAC